MIKVDVASNFDGDIENERASFKGDNDKSKKATVIITLLVN